MRCTLGVAIREMAIKASGERGREGNNEGHKSHWNSNTDRVRETRGGREGAAMEVRGKQESSQPLRKRRGQ